MYSFDIKSKKLKRVFQGVDSGSGYGKYLLVKPYEGVAGCSEIRIFNCQKQKVKNIVRGEQRRRQQPYWKKVYYGEATKMGKNGTPSAFAIKSYNCKAGKKKAIVKEIKGSFITAIDEKSVTYVAYSKGWEATTYKYDYSTGKKRKM